MKKTLVLAMATLLLFSSKAFASWYHVENYVGTLGADPIHFSLQTYDGFGSGLNVQASYFLDATQSPVAVYGKADGKTLQLCEISSKEEFRNILIMGSKTPIETKGCPLSLELGAEGATGTWSKDGKQYPVILRKVATLDDSGEGSVEGVMEIPFWSATATHRFSGIYTKSEIGICMEKLQVINRKTMKVDQEITYKDDICNVGNVMTTIYRNVETFSENGVDSMTVGFSDNRGGYEMSYTYDKKTGQYQPVE